MRKFMDEQWGVMLGVKEYYWETMSIDEELWVLMGGYEKWESMSVGDLWKIVKISKG